MKLTIYILAVSALALAFAWFREIHQKHAYRRVAEECAKSHSEMLDSFENREREILSELTWYKNDANRLAGIVAQYITDIDRTAALLKDEKPPALTEERDALRLHQSQPSKI
jgi:hypothetical protein